MGLCVGFRLPFPLIVVLVARAIITPSPAVQLFKREEP